MTAASHELKTIGARPQWLDWRPRCSCGWSVIVRSADMALEDFQTHLDDVDDLARGIAQREDRIAAREMALLAPDEPFGSICEAS